MIKIATDCLNRDTADEAPAAGRRDVVMVGVGSASPKAAAALAHALELPIETVVDAIYRAPVRLLGNLLPADAGRLVDMIGELGLEAAAVPAGRALQRGATFDIAGWIADPAQTEAAAAALAIFLGTTPAIALDTLLTPPGILIGDVSTATLTALERALPASAVKLVAADPRTSRYALFAARLSRPQADALHPYLPTGTSIGRDGDATLFDLSRNAADAIWRRLKAPETVRIVNQAFLRFTILLHSIPADGGAALDALAGVPEGDYPLLVGALPVPVEVGVGYDDVAPRLAAFTAAGFGVTAELTTFACVALDILAAPAGALQAAGFNARPPFRTVPMAEPRALWLRAQLEAAGADVMAAA